MKFIKTGLLTMLVSLFILGGCKNPTGVGLDVDPNIALNSKIVDTTTVFTKLLKIDSVIANGTQTSVLAYFKDPDMGTTTSNIATALTLPNNNFTFGKNPVLDSAVLVLPLRSFYGDSLNTNYTAEVRQLNEVLYSDVQKIYYNTKKWNVKSTILGSVNFKANYKDSIILQDIKVGKKDTIKKVGPQIRIIIDPNFVTNNILRADSLNLINNKVFNNLIKGLYVSLNKSATTNNGGIFLIDTYTQGAARLDLFYKRTSAKSGIDTVSTSLAIAGSSGDAVSELNWDINGTAVQSELQSTGKTNNNLYIKGLSGTKIKLDFPYLSKLKSLGTNISINRAELVLQVIGGKEMPYKPIPLLHVFRYDIAERPQYLPDESPRDPRNLGAGYIGGFYNTLSKSYIFNLTGYIQDLINGKTTNYGTFITTTDFTNASGTFNAIGRSITGGANVTYKAKLKIYYTDLK